MNPAVFLSWISVAKEAYDVYTLVKGPGKHPDSKRFQKYYEALLRKKKRKERKIDEINEKINDLHRDPDRSRRAY